MKSRTFETLFADWQRRAAELDARLAALGQDEVDVSQPGWEARLAASPHPADAAGVRDGVQAFFDGIVDGFETLEPEQSLQLIGLMASHPSLMRAAVVGGDPDTPEGLRNAVILFILDDQSCDPRDSLLRLNELEDRARRLGAAGKRLFRRLAALASDEDHHGWGSTRDFLTGGPGAE